MASPIVPGPTYDEMLDPSLLPEGLRAAALRAWAGDEMNPLNLFNITWRLADGHVNHILFPPQLTGVPCNIIVMLGQHYPSGSHKVGPAYATLAEAEATEGLRPGERTIIGPSTGNFGIGTAYVSALKHYQALVVMPDNMSKERYDRIQRYGGELDLTPGTESDVILTLERTHQEYMTNPRYKVLAQFELLPNYRFHRYVTGQSAIALASQYGNGEIAAFVSAPGSAGTLAAGDEIKALFPNAIISAVEPRECPTLYNEGQGHHRIEGIGDKMVTLIHNVLNTDYVVLVHDDDTVKGVKLIQDGAAALLTERLGVPDAVASDLWGKFGMSGICNVIGAIKTAKLLGLGPGDNVITVATDAFDRYPSVMEDLVARVGPPDEATLECWASDIFLGATTSEILDTRSGAEKERLAIMKQTMWSRFGYDDALLNAMMTPDFWEAEYAKIPAMNDAIRELRGPLPFEQGPGDVASSSQ